MTITRLQAPEGLAVCEGCGETPTLWVEGTTLLAECGCYVGMWVVEPSGFDAPSDLQIGQEVQA